MVNALILVNQTGLSDGWRTFVRLAFAAAPILTFWQWWLGDALGVILIGSAILVWDASWFLPVGGVTAARTPE